MRAPFWANAITQGRVAAASVLGQPVPGPIADHYFWTEIARTAIKVVGPLPLVGCPQVLEDIGAGNGLLAWG